MSDICFSIFSGNFNIGLSLISLLSAIMVNRLAQLNQSGAFDDRRGMQTLRGAFAFQFLDERQRVGKVALRVQWIDREVGGHVHDASADVAVKAGHHAGHDNQDRHAQERSED